MKESRLARYNEKIALIRHRVTQIDDWSGEFVTDSLESDEKTLLAIYKAFQEIIEALMDLGAMTLTDSDNAPQDDYQNIDKLHQIGIIPKDAAKSLKAANGLRNWIIHRYNRLDDKLAFDSLNELIPLLLKSLEGISQWLSRQK